ncbi:hypothetical protein DdX_12542 [Ditylenchus destructor]|uniref:Uncharacterized protein n=1 Tax=Ditylenchus destructor TaxID=166010 RepID=A0AAD4MW46_9BILA|nr:hypothetical protein DdX_12542 [Ditylenchus destructor]
MLSGAEPDSSFQLILRRAKCRRNHQSHKCRWKLAAVLKLRRMLRRSLQLMLSGAEQIPANHGRDQEKRQCFPISDPGPFVVPVGPAAP